ncbi:patatin-like phospholipase family protein [Streptomyces sp. HUAS ZL42]|uniref:patatin-like phospholipase family protein n=1 Tax=Streptomyces sp. HUAS ZL42 TaxID=3231715 RepID=UPI00345E3A68
MAAAEHDADRQHALRQEANGSVGLVLAGAGARGAYEAGILSRLLPALEKRNEKPTVYVGTSAGAINAALFASLAHLPAEQAAEQALETWRSVSRNDVFRSVPWSLCAAGLGYTAGLLNLPFGEHGGILDTAPLRSTIERRLNWSWLHDNIRKRRVRALALVTTACRTGLTEIFIESPTPLKLARDAERDVDYVDVEDGLSPEHVVASASIPVVFPPTLLKQSRRQITGWYMDGGVRLNAPIKPAIELGADKIVVIATDPEKYEARPAGPEAGPAPLVQDTCAQLLNGALVDRMIEDLRQLSKTNKLVKADPDAKSSADRPYRIIEHFFAGPAPGPFDELGQIADEVLATGFAGARALRHPDLWLLRALIGPAVSRGELLSYVLFEPEFIDAAIDKGRRDAEHILARASKGNGLWYQ